MRGTMEQGGGEPRSCEPRTAPNVPRACRRKERRAENRDRDVVWQHDAAPEAARLVAPTAATIAAMTLAQRAMSSWLGLLSKSGVVDEDDRSAGAAVAAFVVGEEALEETARWFAAQDAGTRERERRAAIELCIWMAHADREVAPEERHLLRELVAQSGLSDEVQDELVNAVHEPPPLDGIEERLTHPTLRELMLAFAWELAMADGRIDRAESALFDELAERLAIAHERARAIREAIGEELA